MKIDKCVCGKEPHLVCDRKRVGKKFVLLCSVCGYHVHAVTEKLLIVKWNELIKSKRQVLDK